jgi:hypothetical protein
VALFVSIKLKVLEIINMAMESKKLILIDYGHLKILQMDLITCLLKQSEGNSKLPQSFIQMIFDGLGRNI